MIIFDKSAQNSQGYLSYPEISLRAAKCTSGLVRLQDKRVTAG
jgi:hypothetical protein